MNETQIEETLGFLNSNLNLDYKRKYFVNMHYNYK